MLKRAKEIIEREIEALNNIPIDENIKLAVDILSSCRGKVVFCGMGKAGLVAKKISATLASTGTSSTFLHPAEAHHGDFGVVQKDDIILAISYSGETDEVCSLVPHFKRIGTPIIAITGDPNSTMARLAYSHINASVKLEACSLNLAPTATTTVALAIGDALAVVLLEMRGL